PRRTSGAALLYLFGARMQGSVARAAGHAGSRGRRGPTLLPAAPLLPAAGLAPKRVAVRRDEVPLGAEPFDILPVRVARVLVAGVVVERPAVVRDLPRPVPTLDRAEHRPADRRIGRDGLALTEQRRP